MTGQPAPSPADAARKQSRIAALRARYEALRAEGQAPGAFEARIAAAPRIAHDLPAASLRLAVDIPAGWYWYGRIPRGTCLRLDNEHGTPGLSCLLWNAADTSERLCVTDTVKVQWTTAIGHGRLLLSDMGRVLASIVEDTCGRHDLLLGGGPVRSDAISSPLSSRNSAENLQMAAAKLGLGPRDLHAPATFFAPIRVDTVQRFSWDRSASLIGTYLDLYAEMDMLAAVSNVPHPMAPEGFAANQARLALWRPERDDLSRFCQDASGEARRAFARTRAYLSERDGSHDSRG